MSNKQARRAARPAATSAPTTPSGAAPDRAAMRRSLRLRVSSGIMALGGAMVVVGAILPWVTKADGTDVPGFGTIPGLGALVLGVTVVTLAALLYLRPDLPNARGLAWAGLFACIGTGVMTVIGAVLLDQSSGAQASMGVLPAFSGGIISTMGVRGLLERR